jgi:hypothetical protein
MRRRQPLPKTCGAGRGAEAAEPPHDAATPPVVAARHPQTRLVAGLGVALAFQTKAACDTGART